MLTKSLAMSIVVAVLAASSAVAGTSGHSSAVEVSRLGAKTEAAGFLALNRYLVERGAAATASLGGLTESKGYTAINEYLQQRAAGTQTVSVHATFAWRDAFMGAAVAVGVVLIGGAGAIAVRRRQALLALRH